MRHKEHNQPAQVQYMKQGICGVLGLLLMLCLGLRGTAGDVLPLQLYSSWHSMEMNVNYHVYQIDLRCPALTGGDLYISINRPESHTLFGYASLGASMGACGDYPNPNDITTYQYTTYQGLSLPPASGMYIPKAAQKVVYITVATAFDSTYFDYNLAAKFVPSSSSGSVEYVSTIPKETVASTNTCLPLAPQNLFMGFSMQLDLSIAYGQWSDPTVLSICPSMLSTTFGTSNICLEIKVIGLDAGSSFFQKLSEQAVPSEFNIWAGMRLATDTDSGLARLNESILSQVNSISGPA
ncbi:hypothetical protein Pelo_15522 [Pelomyxa schiedti]|nr:hypothetical protein Pelo_15522 [Pelomyxa schiedti]